MARKGSTALHAILVGGSKRIAQTGSIISGESVTALRDAEVNPKEDRALHQSDSVMTSPGRYSRYANRCP